MSPKKKPQNWSHHVSEVPIINPSPQKSSHALHDFLMISMISMISRLVHHDLPIVMAGCTASRDDRGLQTWSEASCASEAVPGHGRSPETTTGVPR